MNKTIETPAPFVPQIRLYQDWLRDQRGLSFDSYDALWRWSTTDLPAFWQSIWDYFGMHSPTAHARVVGDTHMPVEAFEANLCWMAERFHVVPLADIVQRIEQGRMPDARGEVALTFDDGQACLKWLPRPSSKVRATISSRPGRCSGGWACRPRSSSAPT